MHDGLRLDFDALPRGRVANANRRCGKTLSKIQKMNCVVVIFTNGDGHALALRDG